MLAKHFKAKRLYLTRDEHYMLYTILKKANIDDISEESWPVFQSLSNKINAEKKNQNGREVIQLKSWNKNKTVAVVLDTFINEKSKVIFRSNRFIILNDSEERTIYHRSFVELANKNGNESYNGELFIEEDDFIQIKERVKVLDLKFERLP